MYLLPWWLNHHKKMFQHGIMINHHSTDFSVEIIRRITPEWDIVESELSEFDAFRTDLEVMKYEEQVTGFKIALNVTEFLMPVTSLDEIEQLLVETGRVGCSASGIICVDNNPAEIPVYEAPLQSQKYWGYDDNLNLDKQSREDLGYTLVPCRNRFYHSDKVGMYHPGRHASWHQDAPFRIKDIMVFYYGYAPWNESFKARKHQIKEKVSLGDLKRKWGAHHFKDNEELDADFLKQTTLSSDLNNHPFASQALRLWCK